MGLTYMKRFDNVVIDYISETMMFGASPIKDFGIQLKFNAEANYYAYYISFYANGLTYNGQINTGSPVIILSSQLTQNQVDTYKKNGQTYAWIQNFKIADKIMEKVPVLYNPSDKLAPADM